MRKNVVITGADGFIGKNLYLRLQELGCFDLARLTRHSPPQEWESAVTRADGIVHLAGVNRPPDPSQFEDNAAAACLLADAVARRSRPLPILYTSSVKAAEGSPYGISKKAAEDRLLKLASDTNSPVAIFRLPNVYGKWCRPDYNSAIATFCHNISRDLPIIIHDPSLPVSAVYIDDVVKEFERLLRLDTFETGFYEITPVYESTVGEISEIIKGFRADRSQYLIANVGTGFLRTLYATYVSYLPEAEFSYDLVSHRDPRGTFSEMLKTREAGQFSYFTALPKVTRGGHYHHTKTEKFLIVHGEALFRFRHMLTGATHQIRTSGDKPEVVETIPGWAHDVTNVGEGVMVSLLWANEIFDRDRPDTISSKV